MIDSLNHVREMISMDKKLMMLLFLRDTFHAHTKSMFHCLFSSLLLGFISCENILIGEEEWEVKSCCSCCLLIHSILYMYSLLIARLVSVVVVQRWKMFEKLFDQLLSVIACRRGCCWARWWWTRSGLLLIANICCCSAQMKWGIGLDFERKGFLWRCALISDRARGVDQMNKLSLSLRKEGGPLWACNVMRTRRNEKYLKN